MPSKFEDVCITHYGNTMLISLATEIRLIYNDRSTLKLALKCSLLLKRTNSRNLLHLSIKNVQVPSYSPYK